MTHGSSAALCLCCDYAFQIFLVIWELTDEHPVGAKVNLRLFTNRNFCIGTILLTLGFAGFFSINLILPPGCQWLQSQMGYTSVWAGLAAGTDGVIVDPYS